MLFRSRQDAFCERLKQWIPNALPIVTRDGGFDRDTARHLVRHCLLDAIRRRRSIDAIYATSDDMAIGAVQALEQCGHKEFCRTYVVGFDGIPEATQMIDASSTRLVNTVVQDGAALAAAAAAAFAALERGASTRQVYLVPPRLYRPIPGWRGLSRTG